MKLKIYFKNIKIKALNININDSNSSTSKKPFIEIKVKANK